MIPMKRTITAALISLTLAVTSVTATATPAQAGQNDVAKALIGIAALYAISEAVRSNRSSRQVSRQVSRAPVRQVRPVIRPGRQIGKYNHWTLPRKCVTRINTRRGAQNFLGQRCLRKNLKRAKMLPATCLREVRSRGNWRKMYKARCLRNNGYRMEARY
jgi:hypothetical protein